MKATSSPKNLIVVHCSAYGYVCPTWLCLCLIKNTFLIQMLKIAMFNIRKHNTKMCTIPNKNFIPFP